MSREELIAFLLNDYSPTPLVAPWNGGSGFFPKDNQAAINAISESTVDRFRQYRKLIEASRTALASLGLSEKPDSDDKPRLLQQCRNVFPDGALDWLDAAFVLTDDGPKYPPLLGTGGNDGRLEFTNNYMQRLVETFDLQTGEAKPESRPLLEDAIFDACGTTRDKAAIGQFDPGSAGGANSAGGYDANPTMNVWDFILMLGGAIAFAGASVRKLESSTSGTLAYPFCVRPAGVGYGSSDLSDEGLSRSEMWMPLWSEPTSFPAISHLLSEGRVNIGRRQARNGVDFARAVASVGVDRGIDGFQRFGFQQRNGLSYFAVSLGRFDVTQPSSIVSLLNRLDGWLDRFRRAATGQHAPARAATAIRLAASLASLGFFSELRVEKESSIDSVGPFRRHLEPINPNALRNKKNRRALWADHANDPSLVWSAGGLVQNLNRVLNRRMIDAIRLSDNNLHAPFDGKCPALLSDVFHFIEGNVDYELIESLARGLMLIDWAKVKRDDIPWQRERRPIRKSDPIPSAAYCLLKLCLLPHPVPTEDGDVEVKLTPQIARRASTGHLTEATKLAARRLKASGLKPAITEVHCADRGTALRTSAALVFPISFKASTVRFVRDRVMVRESPSDDFDNPDVSTTEVGVGT